MQRILKQWRCRNCWNHGESLNGVVYYAVDWLAGCHAFLDAESKIERRVICLCLHCKVERIYFCVGFCFFLFILQIFGVDGGRVRQGEEASKQASDKVSRTFLQQQTIRARFFLANTGSNKKILAPTSQRSLSHIVTDCVFQASNQQRKKENSEHPSSSSSCHKTTSSLPSLLSSFFSLLLLLILKTKQHLLFQESYHISLQKLHTSINTYSPSYTYS